MNVQNSVFKLLSYSGFEDVDLFIYFDYTEHVELSIKIFFSYNQK